MNKTEKLRDREKEFFYHVLNSIKTDKLPMKLFLSGGACVAKSTVTNALNYIECKLLDYYYARY